MCAGTMVVLTLTTALIFSLVVFPALCYCVNLHNSDVGSLSALFQGRWGDFWGRGCGGSSPGGERHGAYVKVRNDGPDVLPEEIIELAGLETIGSEGRTGEPQAGGFASSTHAGTHPPSLDAPHVRGRYSSWYSENLQPAGRSISRQHMPEEGTTHASSEEGQEDMHAPLRHASETAAAEIFPIGNMSVRSEAGTSSSNWGSYGGRRSSSSGTRPDSLLFQEWHMSGIPSTSSSALQPSMMRSGYDGSQPDHESYEGPATPAAAESASERISWGEGRAGTQCQGGSGRSSKRKALPDKQRRSKVAEVGAHAIGGSIENLVEGRESSNCGSMNVDAVPTGVDAIGGSVIGSGSDTSKESL